MDSLPVSPYSPSYDSDVIPSPETQTEDYELDYDPGSFAMNHSEYTSGCAPSQLQQDFSRGDTGSGQYMGSERNITQHQEMDGYFRNSDNFSQSEFMTNKQSQGACEERTYNKLHHSQGRSQNFYTEGQNQGQLAVVPDARQWSSFPSSNRHEEGYTEQWYGSSFQNEFDPRVDVPRGERHEISSNATQQYYQQQPITQYMAQDHTHLPVGRVGDYGVSGEAAPHLAAAGFNVHPHTENSHVHSDSIAPEPGEQFVVNEQRQLQTYADVTMGHIPMAPQSYMTQRLPYQAIQVCHGVVSTNANHHFLYPGSGGGMYHSDTFIPPGQAQCYGAWSDRNVRVSGFSGGMISGTLTGTPHWNMLSYPVSAHSAPPN